MEGTANCWEETLPERGSSGSRRGMVEAVVAVMWFLCSPCGNTGRCACPLVVSAPTHSPCWGTLCFLELGLGLGAEPGPLSVPGDLPLFISWVAAASFIEEETWVQRGMVAGPGPHSKGLCQAPTAVGSSLSLSHFPMPLKVIPGVTSKRRASI